MHKKYTNSQNTQVVKSRNENWRAQPARTKYTIQRNLRWKPIVTNTLVD